MGKTSSSVKNAWNAKTYKRYTVNLRKDEDESYIKQVEDHKQNGVEVSELFKAGLDALNKGK